MEIIPKIISYFILALITTLGTNLIWTVASTANAATEPIKLGVKVWAPDFFSYLAQEKGFFEQNKVKVELTLIQDYRQILNNYSNRDFDGMIPVYSDLVYQNSQGINSRVVYAVDHREARRYSILELARFSTSYSGARDSPMPGAIGKVCRKNGLAAHAECHTGIVRRA